MAQDLPAPDGQDKVIIVDDQEDMRFFLSLVFQEAGYEVAAAESGLQGLQLIATESPSLILLDLNMPGISGWEVIERLKAAQNPTPIVVVSGAHEEIGRGPLGPPVAGFLAKPFRVDEVLRMAQQAIAAHRAQPEFQERRRARRRSLVMGARLLGKDGESIALGTIVNLSRGGTRFDLGLSLEPGRVVRIAFDAPGLETSFALDGEIRWSKEGALGIEFRDLTPAQARDLEELIGSEEG